MIDSGSQGFMNFHIHFVYFRMILAGSILVQILQLAQLLTYTITSYLLNDSLEIGDDVNVGLGGRRRCSVSVLVGSVG